MTTTDVSAIRLGHAAANAGALLGPDAKPPKMRHLCKNMQKAVQNTATRLLTIIGISVPSLSGTTPVPEGRLSRIHFSYHKVISVPVIEPALALEAGHSQDGTVMHHHEVHKFHKDGQPRGPFLHRVHRALMTLGPWEGRMVAFVLGLFFVLNVVDSTLSTDGVVGCGIGVLLRMVWVLAVLLVRGARGSPEREETLLVYAEEIVPLYTETDEKKFTNNGEN
jgi:hypothetical protein